MGEGRRRGWPPSSFLSPSPSVSDLFPKLNSPPPAPPPPMLGERCPASWRWALTRRVSTLVGSGGGSQAQRLFSSSSTLPRRLLPPLHQIRNEEQQDPFELVADELSILASRLRSMVAAEAPKLASAAEYFFKMGAEGNRF